MSDSATAYRTTLASPLGELLLVGDGRRLRHLALQEGRRPLAIEPGWRSDRAPFAAAIEQLGGYFAGERRRFELELEPQGTAFQRRVWSELSALGYGTTITYTELAACSGRAGAARAAGAANARNPIAIVIPCHRVVGLDGTLTGYAGGLERKRFLLELERGARPPPRVEAARP